jgi:hypothetical protein
METAQPSWHCIANLGDINPHEHGGEFVLIDKRGVYTPELWILTVSDSGKRHLCRLALDLCTRCPSAPDSVSDNRFHADSPAWFGKADDLKSVANSSALSDWQFRDSLTSSDPLTRAGAYSLLVAYFGSENFGGEDEMTPSESRKLCTVMRRHIAAANNWKDGF